MAYNLEVKALIAERERLLTDIKTNDNAFVKLLNTMANFHRYSLEDQLNLYYRAPKNSRALGAKELWENKFHTTLVPGAEPIILQDGEDGVKTVYDVRDTMGYLTGKLGNIPWRAGQDYANMILDYIGAEEDSPLDKSLYESLRLVTGGDENITTAVNYILRKRLDLPMTDLAVRKLPRSYEFLAAVNQEAKTTVDLFREEIIRYDRINSSPIRGNDVSADPLVRSVEFTQTELSGRGTERGVAENDPGWDGERVSEGVRGHDVGSAPGDGGQAGAEAGSNGGNEEEGYAGLRRGVQSGTGDSQRDSDAGSPAVSDPLESSVRDWYAQNYPDDELKDEIKNVTFLEAFKSLANDSFYDTIGVRDSVVRERIFTRFAEIFDADYESIYKEYLEGVEKAKAVQEEPADNTPSEIERLAQEIFKQYAKASYKVKANAIAAAFGTTGAAIQSYPATGDWRGPTNVYLNFNNGRRLFLFTSATRYDAGFGETIDEFIADKLLRYNPEIVSATKKYALDALRKQEIKDNAAAAERGLKPYKVLAVELYDGKADAQSHIPLGTYFVTLEIAGKIYSHADSYLNTMIQTGRVGKTEMDYLVAKGIQTPDYVFNNMGFSTDSDLYAVPMSDEVVERARAAYLEQVKEAEETSSTETVVNEPETGEFSDTSVTEEPAVEAPVPKTGAFSDTDEPAVEESVKESAEPVIREPETGELSDTSTTEELAVEEAVEPEPVEVHEPEPEETTEAESVTVVGAPKEAAPVQERTSGKIFSPGDKEDYAKLANAEQIDLDTVSFTATMASVLGKRQVFRRNLAGIQIYHKLALENRKPTEQEMAILKAYSGFGGISEAFDPKNSRWSAEYEMLRANLTEDEYASARNSVLTAYYTPKELVKNIYAGLVEAGLQGPLNVLDPSMGSGRFFEEMPDELKAEANTVGMELDIATAKIARLVNQDTEVVNTGFENTSYPVGAFDLSITNVPFGSIVINDPKYPGRNYFIHDYFINKMLDQTRRGGIVAVITSTGTLDKQDETARRMFARKAELVKALRLPGVVQGSLGVFSEAGTVVSTDVLIFKRREKDLEPNEKMPSWVGLKEVYDLDRESRGSKKIKATINAYFGEHPDDILGDRYIARNKYNGVLETIVGPKYTENGLVYVFPLVKERIASVGKIYIPLPEALPIPKQEIVEQPKGNVEAGLFIDNGILKSRDTRGRESKADVPEKDIPQILAAVRIRDCVRLMLNEEVKDCSDERLAELQQILNELYDGYVKEYGHFTGDKTLKKAFDKDSSLPLLTALERFEGEKFVGKADFFSQRTIQAYHPPTSAATAHDALMISMREKGEVDLGYMARLVRNKPLEDIIDELSEREEIFRDIAGTDKYLIADEYLSGDVREKIENLERYKANRVKTAELTAAQTITGIGNSINPYEVKALEFYRAQGIPFENAAGKLKIDCATLSETQKEALFKPENYAALCYSIVAGSPGVAVEVNVRRKQEPAEAPYFNDPRFIFNLSLACAFTDGDVPSMLEARTEDYYSIRSIHRFLTVRLLNKDNNFNGDLQIKAKTDLLVYNFLTETSARMPLAEWEELFVPEGSYWANSKLHEKAEAYADEFNAKVTELLKTDTGLQNTIKAIDKNLAALERVKPKDLSAEEISISLGAGWIRPNDIAQFAVDAFKQSLASMQVEYAPVTNKWSVKYTGPLTPASTVTYGTEDKSAIELLEAALNHTAVSVRKEITRMTPNGPKDVMVVDREKTLVANQKLQDIKAAFKKWIYQDEERKNYYVDYYNRHFNNIVPRRYDGSHLTFPGMNVKIQLKPHQKDAVARTLYGGNTLLAHVVGAGKTFEMQASAMESKRLGLCKKSMMIMPKHLVEQFGAEFIRLYPEAKILVASPADFTKEKRREFCTRIMSQNWDAVVMSYEQFKSIPLSAERRKLFLERQLDQIMAYLNEVKIKKTGRGFSVKQAVSQANGLRRRLEEMERAYNSKQDDTITFEQLGVDRLYVDESHYYKNLYFVTRMSGFPNNVVEKTDDMIAKCDYLNEKTGERGIVFASGTPVSNSMSELYTLSRYLKPSRLLSQGFTGFDLWASTFGDEVTTAEIDATGKDYRFTTRFAKFINVPELMSIFREFADVKLADQLDLDTPDYKVTLCESTPSPVQRAFMRSLVERSEQIRSGNPMVTNAKANAENPGKGIDNMLAIIREGRLAALDERSVIPGAEANPTGKIAQCVNRVVEIYENTVVSKSTQIIFCDESVPNNEGRFSVYEAIKSDLMDRGVKEKEIAFIHDFDTPAKRENLFKKVRTGTIRVLLGSTDKLGVGTNVQDKLAAIHELDCPWKPAQIEQRRGRIVRVGNENKNVDIYRYITKGTFDAYVWQMNERKQSFVAQIMKGDSPERFCEDYDEVQIQAGQAKAACTENPLFKEKMTLETELKALKINKAQFLEAQKKLAYDVDHIFPIALKDYAEKETYLAQDLERFNAGKNKPFILNGYTYKTKEEIDAALQKAAKRATDSEYDGNREGGSYHGLKFSINLVELRPCVDYMGGQCYPHRIFKTTPEKNFESVARVGEEIKELLESVRKKKQSAKERLEQSKALLNKGFPKQAEIDEKERRLEEINLQIFDTDEKEIEEEKAARLEVIQSDPLPGNLCANEFIVLSRTYLSLHDNKWDDKEGNKAVTKAMMRKNFTEQEMIDAIYTYSPTVLGKNEVKDFVQELRGGKCEKAR